MEAASWNLVRTRWSLRRYCEYSTLLILVCSNLILILRQGHRKNTVQAMAVVKLYLSGQVRYTLWKIKFHQCTRYPVSTLGRVEKSKNGFWWNGYCFLNAFWYVKNRGNFFFDDRKFFDRWNFTWKLRIFAVFGAFRRNHKISLTA